MINVLGRIKQAFAPAADEDVANKKYVDDAAAAIEERIDEIVAALAAGGGTGGGGDEPIAPTTPSGILLEIPANTTNTFIFDVDPTKEIFIVPTSFLSGISL